MRSPRKEAVMEFPSYYSILTADVRYDPRLGKPNARELYSEITALSNKDGYCHASNSYFARLYSVDTGTISRWISLLEECGYLQRKIIYHDGSKQVKERRLYPVSDPIGRKRNTPTQKTQEGIGTSAYTPTQKTQDPIGRKRKENNIKKNIMNKNTINNNSIPVVDSEDKQLEFVDVQVSYQLNLRPRNGIPSKINIELEQFTKSMGAKLVIFAIERAVNQVPNPNWNYIKAILTNWQKAKITTIEDVEKADVAYQQRKNQQKTSYKDTRKIVQKETLPNWAKPGYQEAEVADDPDKSAEIARLMAKIKDGTNGD